MFGLFKKLLSSPAPQPDKLELLQKQILEAKNLDEQIKYTSTFIENLSHRLIFNSSASSAERSITSNALKFFRDFINRQTNVDFLHNLLKVFDYFFIYRDSPLKALKDQVSAKLDTLFNALPLRDQVNWQIRWIRTPYASTLGLIRISDPIATEQYMQSLASLAFKHDRIIGLEPEIKVNAAPDDEIVHINDLLSLTSLSSSLMSNAQGLFDIACSLKRTDLALAIFHRDPFDRRLAISTAIKQECYDLAEEKLATEDTQAFCRLNIAKKAIEKKDNVKAESYRTKYNLDPQQLAEHAAWCGNISYLDNLITNLRPHLNLDNIQFLANEQCAVFMAKKYKTNCWPLYIANVERDRTIDKQFKQIYIENFRQKQAKMEKLLHGMSNVSPTRMMFSSLEGGASLSTSSESKNTPVSTAGIKFSSSSI